MTVDDVIQAFECLASDDSEALPVEDAMATLAAIMADEKTPNDLRLELLDVGATLWRLGLAARMGE